MGDGARVCGRCRYYRGAGAYPEVLGECEYFGTIVPYEQEACPEFKEKELKRMAELLGGVVAEGE